jgi:hypothetical protein
MTGRRTLLGLSLTLVTLAAAAADAGETLSSGPGPGLNLDLGIGRSERGTTVDTLGLGRATETDRFGVNLNRDGSLTAQHRNQAGLGWAATYGEDSQQLILRLDRQF